METPSDPTPVELAVEYIEAFGRRDMAAVANCLATGIRLESPRVRLSGIEPVLEAVGQFAQVVDGVEIIAALGDSEQATVMYDMRTGPFGTLRAANHLLVQDGKVVADTLVFDTYEVRRAEAEAGVGGGEGLPE
jgi:hypothetical protein